MGDVITLNDSDQDKFRGFTDKDVVLSWADCPDCNGRGWFLIRPFMTGGSNGAGGIGNMRQCETCAKEYAKAKGGA